eukprot:m.285198 g.285198  ORF g.285198 m.285198 type:complete len:826 (+) comp15770_c0_seq2:113-2590(+)
MRCRSRIITDRERLAAIAKRTLANLMRIIFHRPSQHQTCIARMKAKVEMHLAVVVVLCCVCACTCTSTSLFDLEQALMEDFFPATSAKCVARAAAQTDASWQFTYDFTSNDNTSRWDATTVQYEDQVFLAEVSHEDPNSNRSWTLRVAKGSNVYSFVGAYGEAMPPQYHDQAPWIDEVWQLVAVNSALNKPPETPYFIHQAGAYQRDPPITDVPFFSPNVAKHCADGACSFVSWGTQAHVPTAFKSFALYGTRYRDCGNGILEVTYVMHNTAPTSDTTSSWTYLNVPWGGVRTSTLNDILLPSKDQTAHTKLDIPNWGSSFLKNLADFGGYTTFAEGLSIDTTFDMPCGDGSGAVVDCSTASATELVLQMASDNPCAESAWHTSAWGRYTVRCVLQSTVNLGIFGCHSCLLQFVTPRGDIIGIEGVLHWAHSGVNSYLWPSVSAEKMNSLLSAADVLTVRRVQTGKAAKDNLALTFIHGQNLPGSWQRAPNRVRIGSAGSVPRDYTVYTVNSLPRGITRGDTYTYRQYIATGRLQNIEAVKEWVDETEQMLYPEEEAPVGRGVHLMSIDASRFTAVLGDKGAVTVPSTVPACGAVRCSGTTTPRQGSAALYMMTCGTQTYVGHDQFAFTPEDATNNYVRPYVCDGQPTSVRPTWKLLGFFPQDACIFLQGATYDPALCPASTTATTTSTTTTTTTSSTTSTTTTTTLLMTTVGFSTGPTAAPTTTETASTTTSSAASTNTGNPGSNQSSAMETWQKGVAASVPVLLIVAGVIVAVVSISSREKTRRRSLVNPTSGEQLPTYESGKHDLTPPPVYERKTPNPMFEA